MTNCRFACRRSFRGYLCFRDQTIHVGGRPFDGALKGRSFFTSFKRLEQVFKLSLTFLQQPKRLSKGLTGVLVTARRNPALDDLFEFDG